MTHQIIARVVLVMVMLLQRKSPMKTPQCLPHRQGNLPKVVLNQMMIPFHALRK
jgi:hypothetical protein